MGTTNSSFFIPPSPINGSLRALAPGRHPSAMPTISRPAGSVIHAAASFRVYPENRTAISRRLGKSAKAVADDALSADNLLP
ncbi:hypothetical protein [Chromobacterium violaceum]|uniref:hypothetical protein n=1 Tax=Chromobacterium violaceum TaxID=536 RepID=UPI00111BDAE8|nr:hypothetical protein [Chromobacterium violaceum]QRO32574.1 hypothetical protein I6K04_19190 [Chromobacterium violaceum]QRQ17625.1 hypothetical protein I6K03_03535 [Chromobacterium violaceum]